MAKLHVAEGISAESVCSIIAELCDDNYRIVIDYGDTLTKDDGELFAIYSVRVIDTDESEIASGKGFYLSQALANALGGTPERKSEVH